MLLTLMLLLVPASALGLVLGMDRLEVVLLRRPARHRTGSMDRTTESSTSA